MTAVAHERPLQRRQRPAARQDHQRQANGRWQDAGRLVAVADDEDADWARLVDADAVVRLLATLAESLRGVPRDWARRAACASLPGDAHERTATFYARRAPRHEAGPLAVCEGCAVRRLCLAATLVEESRTAARPAGVRGGATAAERRRLLTLGRDAGCVDFEQWGELAERWVDEQPEQ